MIRVSSAFVAVVWFTGCATAPPYDALSPDPRGHWVTVGESRFLYRDLTRPWFGNESEGQNTGELGGQAETRPLPSITPPIGAYDIPFDFGESQLSQEGEAQLEALLVQIRHAQRIAIRGTAGGTNQNVVRLASDRANTIAQYLVGHGVMEDLIEIEEYEPWIRGRRVILSLGTVEQLEQWEKDRTEHNPVPVSTQENTPTASAEELLGVAVPAAPPIRGERLDDE